MLTFAEIKQKCVPGESVLVSDQGRERIFVGFSSCNMIVTDSWGTLARWDENDIKNWSIKPKAKKIVVEQWMNVYERGFGSICTTKEQCDKLASEDRLDCFHFRKEYEVSCE